MTALRRFRSSAPTAPASARPEGTSGDGALLRGVHLGDLIALPDGRSLTVRAKAELPLPVGSMAGWVIAGELEALLSFPPSVSSPVNLYQPVDYLPESMHRARSVFSGSCSYWSPHLPAARQAMGELLYRVAEVAGQVDPLVIVWRSNEAVVFVKASSIPPESLGVLWMPRDAEDVSMVPRHTTVVTSPDNPPAQQPNTPVHVPAPAQVPAHR